MGYKGYMSFSLATPGICRGFQEILICSEMRVVAVDARLFKLTGVAFHGGHVFLLVAFEAQLCALLDQ